MPNQENGLRETVRAEGLAQIRRREVPTARRIRTAIGRAGLRTSGVSRIPLDIAERGRIAGESRLEAGIAGQRLGQLGALEQLRERGGIEERLLERRGQIAQSLGARRARSRLINALLSGGVSAATGLLGRRRGPGPTSEDRLNRFLLP